jgi:hypothetical protein
MEFELREMFCQVSNMHFQLHQAHKEVISALSVLFLIILWFVGVVLYFIILFHEIFNKYETLEETYASLDKYLITTTYIGPNTETDMSNDVQLSDSCAICLYDFSKF